MSQKDIENQEDINIANQKDVHYCYEQNKNKNNEPPNFIKLIIGFIKITTFIIPTIAILIFAFLFIKGYKLDKFTKNYGHFDKYLEETYCDIFCCNGEYLYYSKDNSWEIAKDIPIIDKKYNNGCFYSFVSKGNYPFGSIKSNRFGILHERIAVNKIKNKDIKEKISDEELCLLGYKTEDEESWYGSNYDNIQNNILIEKYDFNNPNISGIAIYKDLIIASTDSENYYIYKYTRIYDDLSQFEEVPMINDVFEQIYSCTGIDNVSKYLLEYN